jgi:hypothetical protein
MSPRFAMWIQLNFVYTEMEMNAHRLWRVQRSEKIACLHLYNANNFEEDGLVIALLSVFHVS